MGYLVETDRLATRKWYSQANAWGCSCGHCRNFLAHARGNLLPDSVQTVLKELKIPPEKATYVSELYTDEAGIHYQFSYRIAGRILAELAQEVPAMGRCCQEPYPYGSPDFLEPHFDLEFRVTLPWILQDASG
jgi:hypothetical protein